MIRNSPMNEINENVRPSHGSSIAGTPAINDETEASVSQGTIIDLVPEQGSNHHVRISCPSPVINPARMLHQTSGKMMSRDVSGI